MVQFIGKENVTVSDVLNTDIVLLSITKLETQKLDISQFVKVAQCLEKIGGRGKAKLALLFEGYDDVPEEIFEIPAIRNWVKKAFHRYHHLFYWLTLLDNNASNILACLANPTVVRLGAGEKRSVSSLAAQGIDPHQLPPQYLIIDTPKELAEEIEHAYTKYALDQGNKVSDIIKRLDIIFGYFGS